MVTVFTSALVRRQALLVFLAVSGGCHSSTEAASAASDPSPPEVSTMLVATTHAVPRVHDLPGRLASSRVSEVRARVAGIVLERVFEEGSQVLRGDVLFRLESAVYRAERDERSAALARSRVDLAHTTVRAPIDGWIGRALVTEGALVGEGAATHLATIPHLGCLATARSVDPSSTNPKGDPDRKSVV